MRFNSHRRQNWSIMSDFRSLKLLLLIVAVLTVVDDTTAFGAVRRANRNRRSHRSSRTSRSNPLSGAAANVQKTLSALNAAHSAKVTATSNLVRVRTSVKARYDNAAEAAPVHAEFDKSEAAHKSAKDAVLNQLKQNSTEYQTAQSKLKAVEEQIKSLEVNGSSSQLTDIKAQARQMRLDLSAIETTALQKDGTAQTSQRQRDAASQTLQTLRHKTETSIANDSTLSAAKTKVAQTTAAENAAQMAYNRAVGSANAMAQALRAQAAAQASRPRYVGSGRYGRGRFYGMNQYGVHQHASHRGHTARFHRYR